MKKVLIGAGIVAVAVGSLAFASKGAQTGASQETASATFATVQQDVQQGALFLDVRTPQEYGDGHFVGAVNMPVEEIQAGVQPTVDKTTKIYVYCRSGNRSAQATQLLEQAGFSNIVDLGGLTDVSRIGGQLTR